jgi:hypothetical protein
MSDGPSEDDAALFAALKDEFADLAVDGVQDVSTLDSEDLLRLFHGVERQLRDQGQMINSKTSHGRDLHSRRGAYMFELRRRKLR